MPDVDLWGVTYTGVPAVEHPKDGGGWAQFWDVTGTTAVEEDVATGKVFRKADGTLATGTSSGGGGGKNIQYCMGRYEVAQTAYTATDLSLKVTKAGTYKVYWSMDRNTTSGTNGSRLYKGDTALGTAHTSWTHNGYSCEETLTFSVNDVITVRARSRSTSYYVGVSNLVIIEQ